MLLRATVISCLAIPVMIFSIRFLLPTKTEQEPIFYTLSLQDPTPYTIQDKDEVFSPLSPNEDAMGRILETKTLRVGFHSNSLPFTYFNDANELVGFDIALAHDLAKSLDCKIEFIPFEYRELVEDLKEGKFDIAISSISFTEKRLSQISMTAPYITTERALIVFDHMRDEIATGKGWYQNPEFKVGVLKGTSLETAAHTLLGKEQVVPISSQKDFLHQKEIGLNLDALFWTKDEGTSWSLVHQPYMAVSPSVPLGKEHYVIAMSKSSVELLEFVNYWLDLKKLDGFIEEQREYWILGQVPDTQPRWSIIRDVLHWIK